MKNSLYFFIAALGLSSSLSSCGPRGVEISSKNCWSGKLTPGARVTGSAYLIYFPRQKTVLRNDGCRGEVIGVAAGSDPAFFKKYDDDISKKRNVLGIEVRIKLDGRLSDDKLIFLNKISEDGKVEYFHL